MEVVENKPASSLVVFLGNILKGRPPPLCGRQVSCFPSEERVGGTKGIRP